MFLLVIYTIFSLMSDHVYFNAVSWIVWFIFFVDFVIRFFLAKEKWNFIKQNPLLVIAIIPLDQFFQIARISRIIYLFRIKTITKFHFQPFLERISVASKIKIVLSLIVFFLAEAVVIYGIEPMIVSFREAILCVISYLMFFGRNFYVVESSFTQLLIVINSIIGILMHGLAVQWGMTKAEGLFKKLRAKNESSYPM